MDDTGGSVAGEVEIWWKSTSSPAACWYGERDVVVALRSSATYTEDWIEPNGLHRTRSMSVEVNTGEDNVWRLSKASVPGGIDISRNRECDAEAHLWRGSAELTRCQETKKTNPREEIGSSG